MTPVRLVQIAVLIALASAGCANSPEPAQDGVAGGAATSGPFGTQPPPAGTSSASAGQGGAVATSGAGGAAGPITPDPTSGAGSGGSGGQPIAAGSDATGAGGEAGSAPAGDDGGAPPASDSPLPPTSDYGAPGPFADAKMFSNVGPSGNYTMFRPDASLGKDGFKHAIVSWGNGITTTPDMYQETLTLIATHGFVIIGVNDTTVEEPAVSAGLDWLIEQNDAPGELHGKLDVTREATVGYSWGGGASIDAAYRPNVLCTVSMHGMPPRKTDAFTAMHAPLLLYTSTGDSFVTASQYVTPNYEKSTVQTFYATLDDPTAGHLYVADASTNIICAGGAALGLGECRGAPDERAPTIAWLRLWLYGDQAARKYFFGDDCELCKSPWTMPQRKNWP